MGIFGAGRSLYDFGAARDARSRRMNSFLGQFNRPLDFGFEGLKINTRQNSRAAVLKVTRQGNANQFLTVDTDSDGDVSLKMSSGGGSTAGIRVESGGGCEFFLSDAHATRFYADENGARFNWKQTELSVNTAIAIQDNYFPVTAGGRTITLSDGSWAEGQLTDGDWISIYDQNGSAAAGPITIDVSGTTVNGSSANLTITDNYGGYYFIYNEGDDEWVAWKLTPARGSATGGVEDITAVAVDTTLTNAHRTVLVSPILSSRTITLPAAASHTGRIYTIKHAYNTANTVTIDANGSETIDGALTKVLTLQYQSLTIHCDGSNWHII